MRSLWLLARLNDAIHLRTSRVASYQRHLLRRNRPIPLSRYAFFSYSDGNLLIRLELSAFQEFLTNHCTLQGRVSREDLTMVRINLPGRLKSYNSKNGSNGNTQTGSRNSSPMRALGDTRNLVLKTTVLRVRRIYFFQFIRDPINSFVGEKPSGKRQERY